MTYENDTHEKDFQNILNEMTEKENTDKEFSLNSDIDIDNLNLNNDEENKEKEEENVVAEDNFNPENIDNLDDVKEDDLPEVSEDDEYYRLINGDDEDDILNEIKHPAMSGGSHVIEPPGNISKAFDMHGKGPVNVMGKGNRRLPKNLRRATKRLRIMRKTQRQIKEDSELEALLDNFDLENDIRKYETIERDEDRLLEDFLNDDSDYNYEDDYPDYDDDYPEYDDDKLDYLNERIENFLNAYDQRKEFMENYEYDEDNPYETDSYEYDDDAETSEREMLREKGINDLLEDSNLPRAFKERAAKLFEAAVQRKTNKNVQDMLEDVVNTVDGYMDQLASRWIEDNSSDGNTEVRNKDTNKLQEEIDNLSDQLTEQYAENVGLNNKITNETRDKIILEYKDGMTLTDFDKFKGLTEDVKFVDENKFRRKLDYIRETYFKNGKTNEIQGSSKFVITDGDISENEEIQEELSPDVQGFVNTLQKIPHLEDCT